VSTNTDVPKAEWQASTRRFEQLYWAEFSMVEDDNVKFAMEDFYKNVLWVSEQTAIVPLGKWHDIQQSSYRLAKALRSSIEASWDLNVDKPRAVPHRPVEPENLRPAHWRMSVSQSMGLRGEAPANTPFIMAAIAAVTLSAAATNAASR
jgi:hypothetical protein